MLNLSRLLPCFKLLPIALLGTAGLGNAHAEIYTCKDSNGHVITSDRPIPECADKTVDVYRNNGAKLKEINGTIASQQRASKQQEEDPQQQGDDALRRDQRYLAAHYANEDAIEQARHKELDAIQTRIDTELRNLNAVNTELAASQKKLPTIPQTLPGQIRELQMKISDLVQSAAESNRMLTTYHAEMVRVNQSFDATHKRYKEVFPPQPPH